MFHIWPRAVSARAMRHVAVGAVSVGQSEVVAHGIPEAGLVFEFRRAWQAVQLVMLSGYYPFFSGPEWSGGVSRGETYGLSPM
jgi:hypothetical protein